MDIQNKDFKACFSCFMLLHTLGNNVKATHGCPYSATGNIFLTWEGKFMTRPALSLIGLPASQSEAE